MQRISLSRTNLFKAIPKMISAHPLRHRLKIIRGLTWNEVRDLFQFAKQRLGEDNLNQVASSLTFTSVLALVPMLTVAFAIFTTFPLFHTFQAALEKYFIQSLMPKGVSNTILGYMTGFASKATGLSVIGAIGLLVTALLMMNTIDQVFNRIWRVKTKRPWLQRILVYWAIITLGPLLIGVSITVTANIFTFTGMVVGKGKLIGSLFYTLLSVLLTTLALTLLYISVPNRNVDWGDAAWGGLVAGLAFEIAKRLFAEFITRFPTYALIYGALAAVPIFLIWLYLSWYIALVGAVLVAALPIIKYERWRHVGAPGSAFIDAMAILAVLFRARSSNDTAAVNATVLRAKTRLGSNEIEELLEKMEARGWVGRMRADAVTRVQWGKRNTEASSYWTLLANPDHLCLSEVYRLFVFDASFSNADANPQANAIAGAGSQALAKQIESVIEQSLCQTLHAHFTQEKPRKNDHQ
jgi:membrane protein